MRQVTLSKAQSEAFAAAFDVEAIRAYVAEHSAEYREFLRFCDDRDKQSPKHRHSRKNDITQDTSDVNFALSDTAPQVSATRSKRTRDKAIHADKVPLEA